MSTEEKKSNQTSKKYQMNLETPILRFKSGFVKKKQIAEDPEEYIRKMFGKDFEFSEKYLKSKINSDTIIKALKRRYKFK